MSAIENMIERAIAVVLGVIGVAGFAAGLLRSNAGQIALAVMSCILAYVLMCESGKEQRKTEKK